MRLAMVGLAVCVLAVPAFAAKHPKKIVVVNMTNATGQSAGTATFTQEKDGKVRISFKLMNIETGEHGIHIHEHPVCDAPDFKTAGGHFNPAGKQHGSLNPMGPHAGDLPANLHITLDPADTKSYLVDSVTMDTGLPNDILANGGTALVIHAREDDMKTDPSGMSGNRVACGVITDANAK